MKFLKIKCILKLALNITNFISGDSKTLGYDS